MRPILSDHCFACHGFDENERQADLRLDVEAGALADLGGYQAVVPGHPEQSAIWQRIMSTDDDEIMPPADFHKPLTDEQKAIIQRWIVAGAEYDQHWSFAELEQPAVPDIQGTSNPIDAFIQQRLQAEGLSPAPEADRATLIRRVTLDLTGLPPTVEEVDAFLADKEPGAYERLVEGLQGRITYGEHLARFWLDLVRYADTHGLHLDNERSMWPYRDWVVRAINQNLPFDEFTRWQLAGDLLPEPTREQLIASGFNRCNVSTSEGGSINEEWIFRYAVDRTATAVEIWMGLTAGCAVCHDHKFDPLSTKEFYSMYAFFHSAADPAMDGNKIDTPPILRLIDEQDEKRLADLREQLAKIDERIEQEFAALDYHDPAEAVPAPEVKRLDEIWFEDAFPEKANVEASGGPALRLIDAKEGPVFSGLLSIARTADNQVSQDFFTSGGNFAVPEDGRFFVHCWLEPDDCPEAIMIQFHSSSWKHRAVWGAEDKIPFGKSGTGERYHAGDLPEKGKWVKLEVDAEQMDLSPGTKVTGFAFTQFGGTVYWDKLGVEAEIDTVHNPRWSWTAWTQQDFSQLRKSLPDHLKREFQGRQPSTWSPEEEARIQEYWLRNIYQGGQDIVRKFEQDKAPLTKEIDSIEKAAPVTFIMADLPKPRESFVMLRGAYDRPGEQVYRDVPEFLPDLLPAGNSSTDVNRLDLANWLLRRDHPLTARVTVNRFWQHFFGTGLVETSGDFGSQGQPPSHPELLDWLAVQFMDDGWNMKQLVKRIVTSHAYRQAAKNSPALAAADPQNRLLARGPRLRLEAEVLRDQALFLGGLLVPTLGGPGVKPYQPPNIWEPVGFGNSNTRYYKQGTGDDLYRRSLYTFLKRTAPPPFMSTFDAPNRELSCPVRQRSNTPMQALQLMNDIQHVEAARGFATGLLEDQDLTDEQRLRRAWRMATSREPDAREMQIILHSLQQHLEHYRQHPEEADALVSYGESPTESNLDKTRLASMTMVTNLILNLDETVNKN